MPWCTEADLVARYSERDLIQRTDRDRLGVIDQTVLAGAIARADRDIDGALADAGYTDLPQGGWSRAQSHAEALTMRYLYADGPAPKEVMDEYAAAQTWLERVARGLIRPPAALFTAETQPASGAVAIDTGGEPVFDALVERWLRP